MIELYNIRYSELTTPISSSSWNLCGEIFNHPDLEDGETIFISCPSTFDEVNDTIITFSGKKYKIMSYWDNRNIVIDKIGKTIRGLG